MATMSLRKITLFAACGAMFAACAEKPTIELVMPEPTPSPQQICQPDALAQERSSAIRTVRGADVSGRQNSQTFLADKLERYEARLEIAYRSMVTSCQIYANCLDRNDADEMRCMRSEENFADARGEFYEMISESDRLAAEVRKVRAQADAKGQQKDERRTSREEREGRCRPECSTTANVFTDDCCPVGDRD